MRPESTRAWRKDGRRTARRAQEPDYYPPASMTPRQTGQALAQEASEMLATQAHIDAAHLDLDRQDAARADFIRWEADMRDTF